VSLDIVKVFLGRTSAENGVLKHIMEIKFARRTLGKKFCTPIQPNRAINQAPTGIGLIGQIRDR
jgi:hypothetical protein